MRAAWRRGQPVLLIAIHLCNVNAHAQERLNQEDIDALIAQGSSAEAIDPAIELARADPDEPRLWEQVRKLAGWNSNAEASLLALQHLVRLRPDDRELRLALSQQLLWAKNTNAALPHARWLLARKQEKDPVALEVAAWILIGEKQMSEARQAVRRWSDAQPDAAQPRWVHADLSHWTVHWRDARDTYPQLYEDDEFGEKARQRTRMLKRDHPTQIQGTFKWWKDSLDVQYLAGGAKSIVQLPARFVLRASAEMGWWRDDNPSLSTDQANVGRGDVKLRYELTQQIQPEVTVGLEADSEGHVAPVLGAGVHLALAGKFFGQVRFHYDRYRSGLEAALRDIRTTGVFALGYAEPHRWIFIGLEASWQRLSDDNDRRYGLVALGAHNPHAFQIEPRIFGQVESWRELRTGASPYFTVSDPWSFGGDITLRYTAPSKVVIVQATFGVIYQQREIGLLPKGQITWNISEHFIGKVSAGFIGSPAYRQTQVNANIGYRF